MTGPNQPVSPFKMIFGKEDQSINAKRLIPFGTLAEVKLATRQKKFHDKSTAMVMVGYPDDHASDCYKFYNPQTKQLIMSRNVTTWYDANDAQRMRLSFYDALRLPTTMPTAKPRKGKTERPSGRKRDDHENVHDTSDEEEYGDDDSEDENLFYDPRQGAPDDDDDSRGAPDDDPDEPDDEDEDKDTNEDTEDDEDDEEKIVYDRTPVGRALKRLGANPRLVDTSQGLRTRRRSYYLDIGTEELVLNTESVTSDFNTPKKFAEAYHGPQKEIWR
jgi:hypothetical protein